jgi:hypothetical protein
MRTQDTAYQYSNKKKNRLLKEPLAELKIQKYSDKSDIA